MIKNALIIALLLLVIYLYYQQRKNTLSDAKNSPKYLELHNQLSEVMKINKIFASFCQNEIGGKDIEEIRTKLNGRTLSEILTQNGDYETDVDTLTREKNELEQDLLSQSNSFKSLIKEKEGIIKRLEKEKKDLKEWSKKQVDELNQKLKDLKKK